MATDYFNFNGDRHSAPGTERPQDPTQIQAELQPPPGPSAGSGAEASPAKAATRSQSDCDWRPNPNAPTAKQWYDASSTRMSQPLQLNQDGSYTVVYGDSLSAIAKRELRSNGKQFSAKDIQAEEARLIALNKDAYPSLDCNKHLVRQGWTLRINSDAPPPPPPQPRVREAPPPPAVVEAPPPPIPPRQLEPLPAPVPLPHRYHHHQRFAPPPGEYLGAPLEYYRHRRHHHYREYPENWERRRYDSPDSRYYGEPLPQEGPPLPILPFLNFGGGFRNHHHRSWGYGYRQAYPPIDDYPPDYSYGPQSYSGGFVRM